ncbi:monovalent cation/H(+) antiporter subunit G [Halobacillus sp. HZG1]|uniref:monovalent cation/H(+) antiporter subunit G n=1 Tax=Halobacillus sp. HZG1 TaxID=3111769 RepID=UPI002DBA70B5|nr:monovalent cation/H(+) antiporter subunit G [Halobacillus sp. HZG1]MEC3884947.1 monovalent cation/H(+) antiporter subunit G [Halobacillus sp. HZG1]
MIDFLHHLRQIVAYVFFLTAFYFLLSTAVGMMRFPDLYTRLHAMSKCLMAGGISVFIGCIMLEESGLVSLKLMVILIFLLLTNPIAMHVIARLSSPLHFLHKTHGKKQSHE